MTSYPESVTTISVSGTSEAPGASAQVRVLPGDDAAILTVTGLPEPARGLRYQLWIVRENDAVSAGFLPPGAIDDDTVAVVNLDDAVALAVTPEPPDNTTAPTAPPVVEVPLTSAA